MSRSEGGVRTIYSFMFVLAMSFGIFFATKESNDASVQADVFPNLAKSSLPPPPEGELVEVSDPPVPTQDMEFNYQQEEHRRKKATGYYGGTSRAAKSYGFKEFLRRNK